MILVTNDLSIADVIWLTEYEELDLVGIVTEKGGPTSHTALLSQTLFIPAVVGVAGALSVIKNNDRIFVDSNSGRSSAIPRPLKSKRLSETSKLRKRSIRSCIEPAGAWQKRKIKFRVTLKAKCGHGFRIR